MDKHSRIVVTGSAGFIGSCLVGFLNEKGFEQLILVDDFTREDRQQNLAGKTYEACIEREVFFDWLAAADRQIDFVFHLGARTDTTEFDYTIQEYFNVTYSRRVWEYCVRHQIPLVYASSAATYGGGEQGYADDHGIVTALQPLNAYGISKNEFDKWVLQQTEQPPFWAGLKFFNVYGPNEYHKGRMASMIWHSYHQIRKHGQVKLFRSHRPDFRDGEQLRDFIYVKDILKVAYWLSQHTSTASGLYNLGTGHARSFVALVTSTFAGMDIPADITYIDMPEDIRDKYQYFTEASMAKLQAAGYPDAFYSLEEGVTDYVSNYLAKDAWY
ncbi:ADP-glyceromanno-heptose 6-epimerase [Chitinophaga nivalis]|uniref:ADP-L-glycero-D-manno-heptose-6-epimerase n=1 Tax=Chitinophaga nivalis TaxID=2991709 RepID=A0ABT3II31_9BACT|nr:ADP-glyceromanno-heptose 6-epimerase [Chitinophaga nivalis]MCW3466686.1 ADP-glyceromanno-heptose 6-epimerase [Chitinophaga nivalis]MCW3483623.1 ADP-glyceromanno-heptose 6-epimerase [Chitinophaga nivalis]